LLGKLRTGITKSGTKAIVERLLEELTLQKGTQAIVERLLGENNVGNLKKSNRPLLGD
jgi:hypothetical protein